MKNEGVTYYESLLEVRPPNPKRRKINERNVEDEFKLKEEEDLGEEELKSDDSLDSEEEEEEEEEEELETQVIITLTKSKSVQDTSGLDTLTTALSFLELDN